MTAKQKYYPWVIMVSCCIFIGIGMGVATNCNGIFMQPVADALHVGRGDVAAYVTFMGAANALTAPLVGSIINKVDIRKLMTASALLSGASFFGLSIIKSLPQFFMFGALCGFGVGLGSFLTITVIINNWFVKNNGLVIGMTLSCSSLVGIVMNPLLNSVIEDMGWRAAYRIMGIMLVSTIPVVWAFIRMYPSQKGSEAWGAGEYGVEAEAEAKKAVANISAKKVVTHPAFLCVVAFAFMQSFLVNHASHFQGIATTAGFTAAVGAVMISASLAGEFTGKLIIGFLADHLGVLKAVYIVAGLGMCALVGLLFIDSLAVAIVLICAYFYGITTAIGSVGYSLIVKNLVGNELYPKCYPWLSITSTIGFSVGFPIIGYIYDITGSYRLSFIMALAGLAVALVLLTAGFKGMERFKEKLKAKA